MIMAKKLKKSNETVTENWVKKLMDELDEEFETKEIRQKEIISTTEYISWLEEFTKIHSFFTVDDWLYSDNEISKSDEKHVEELELLYFEIKEYAKKNFISFNRSEGLEYYSIKYNNVGYQIGEVGFQGGSFYCNRVEIESDEDFINFTDIITNKKQERVDFINKRLSDLSNLIKELLKEEIPIPAIEETIQKTIESDENEE